MKHYVQFETQLKHCLCYPVTEASLNPICTSELHIALQIIVVTYSGLWQHSYYNSLSFLQKGGFQTGLREGKRRLGVAAHFGHIFCIFGRDQHLHLGPEVSLKTIMHRSCPRVPASHCPTPASSCLLHYDFSSFPSCDLKLSLGTDLILWAPSRESQPLQCWSPGRQKSIFAAWCLLWIESQDEATLHSPSMSQSQQNKQSPVTAWFCNSAAWFWTCAAPHMMLPVMGKEFGRDMGRTSLSLLVMMSSTTQVLAFWATWSQEHLQLQTACQGGVFHCPEILLPYSDCHCSAPSPDGWSRPQQTFNSLQGFEEGR